MPSFSVDETRALLASGEYRTIVDAYIGDSVPVIFEDRPGDWESLRRFLSLSLGVPKASFTVVGSGKFGFSLRAAKFGAAFTDGSDVDVDVVSERLFDELWFDLLKLSAAKRASLRSHVKEWLEAHRTRRIYFGRAEPQRLLGAAKLPSRWIRAFASISKIAALSRFDVHGMLFRTQDHLFLHHINGLRRTRAELRNLGEL